MKHPINRREFITASAAFAGGVGLGIGPGTAAAQAPALLRGSLGGIG